MRRVGLILLAIGLAGFLFASARRSRAQEPDGSRAESADRGALSSDAWTADAWETTRWLFMGVVVMGVVFTVLPGKRSAT